MDVERIEANTDSTADPVVIGHKVCTVGTLIPV